MKTIARHLAAGALALAAFATPAFAVDIATVTSDEGVKALLVEDYTVPLVAISFSFDNAGSVQDAAGREGTAQLMTTMLDEGAGERDSQQLQETLADNGMIYRFRVGTDVFSGSLKTLRGDLDQSVGLMADMLNRPRFDAEPLERMKASLANRVRSMETSPGGVMDEAFRAAVFGDHPYARPSNGTLESIAAIEPKDLIAQHRRTLARDNLHVGVVGAISAEELKPILDRLFARLPQKAELTEIPPLPTRAAGDVHVDLDVPQTSLRIVQPGMKRQDPDFYAAYLVDHVLGGGAFQSRLYDEVREKRGLAYGAYSSLWTYDAGGLSVAQSATRQDRAGETVDVMLSQIERMGREGPTEEELRRAKEFIIGTYAISNLDTSDKIANVLVAIQREELGTDYIDRRREVFEAITPEQAKAAARRLYGEKPLVITVGREAPKRAAGAAKEG